MKKTVVIVWAMVLSCWEASSQDLKSVLTLDKREVSLHTKMLKPAIAFGDTIPFTVAVESKESIGLFDLETAWLYFQLKKYKNGKYVAAEEQGWYKTIGGTFQHSMTRSGSHQLRRLKQTKIALQKGAVLTRGFELNDLMGEFTYPGKYMLCTTYEWQIKDSVEFTIRLSYHDVIPRMLEYMQHSNTRHGRISPLRVFTYLTGYTPGDKVILPEAEPSLAPQLRNWWNLHRDLILKMETTLNRVGYRDLDYGKRIVAILKAMESKNYQERLSASNEIQNITNIVLAKPAAGDSDEVIAENSRVVREWWGKNKAVIAWVNRVIIENRIE